MSPCRGEKKAYLNPPAIVYNCKTSHLCVCVCFPDLLGGRFFTITIRIHVMSTNPTKSFRCPTSLTIWTTHAWSAERPLASWTWSAWGDPNLATCEMETKTLCATWVVYFFVGEKNSNSHPLILHVNQPMILHLSVLFLRLLRVVVLFLLLLLLATSHVHSFIVQRPKASALPRFAARSGSVWATEKSMYKAFQWSLEWMIHIWHIMFI